MHPNRKHILIIGYGNPGRRDDGLGPALAAEVERWALPRVTTEADYQLTVEDAAQVADHEIVIFADAAVNGPEPYRFEPLQPRAELSFSSHCLEPASVLALTHALFHKRPAAYLLGIRGYEFNDFGEELSVGARANLSAAAAFLRRLLQDDDNGLNRLPTDFPGLEDAGSLGDKPCKLAST